VSLDAVRRELGVSPEEEQAPVVARARDLAREYLRGGRPFAWNATNVTRLIRDPLVDHFASYGARVRIVYVEAAMEVILCRNRARATPVPEAVIRSLADRLEVPGPAEAHGVEWVWRRS
jgi:predicted kinase